MNVTLRLKRGSNAEPTEVEQVKRERSKLLSNLRLKLGIVILAIFVFGSFLLPFFTSVDPSQQGTYLKNLPISGQHLLGTNALGQDIFWFLVFAIRNSLILGVTVSMGITIISTVVGLSAGYIGGWYERIIMLVIDAFITIPILPILIIILSALARGNTSFLVIGLVLVIFGWAWGARTVRSMALSLREREFVNMARFSGANFFNIIIREIFPYVYAYMVVNFINTILFAINTEAALAVIGLSKVEVPTLGSILFWALNYNALLIGQITWIIGPLVATVLLFLGLFLISTGYNEFSATRRGVA
jgi:peptide/nickel transport system permease protein